MLRPLAGLLFAATASLAAPARHLFLDPSILAGTKGVMLQVNSPSAGELVLTPDHPWEEQWIPFYLTVRDEAGKLRLWYNCRDRDNASNLGYAESTDGAHWTKPNLGIVDYKGSTANNLVGIHSFEGDVSIDPHGPAAERYFYVGSLTHEGGMFRFTSPDGLHWKRDALPLLPFECDSQNVVFWDAAKNKYELYLRSWGPKSPRNMRRRVVHLEADTLSHPIDLKPGGLPYNEGGDKTRRPWIVDEAPIALTCDGDDSPDVDIYTNAIQPYPLDPSWYVGFPSFFRHWVHSPHPIADGWTEAQFVGSADGVHWQRYQRSAYAEAGLPGPYSGSMIYIGVGMVVRGDEIWQYGTRFRTTHGDVAGRKAQPDGGIYRFVQRIDGFVSADFAAGGGECRTIPVSIDGSSLMLNFDAGALGYLKVGLLEADGSAVKGMTADDCEVLRLNSTHALVSWKTARIGPELHGRKLSLVFSGARAKLYSFYFE